MSNCEGAELSQLDPITADERGGHGLEDRGDDRLDVPGVEMGVLGRDTGHKLGSDHGPTDAASFSDVQPRA